MPRPSALVTGADGFIGSHLVEMLRASGHAVTAVVRRTSASQVTRRFKNLSLAPSECAVRILHVDLAGPSAVALLAPETATLWFHLAADAFVDASLSLPAEVVRNNVMSTLNVLEAARLAEPSHLLLASSSEIYGSYTNAIAEDFEPRPSTPYAASKLAADRLCAAYASTFDLPVTIIRPFNTYGPRHVYDVIPRFLSAAGRNQPLTVYGTGEQTRDFTYVSDTLGAFTALARLEPTGAVFNVGSGHSHSIRAIAQRCIQLTNSKSALVFSAPRTADVQHLQADSSKVAAATGWRPAVSIDEGLARTARWVQRQLNTA